MSAFPLMLFTVFLWCAAFKLLEHTDEDGVAGVTGRQSNLGDRRILVGQKITGVFNTLAVHIVIEGFSGKFLKQTGEVKLAEVGKF